MATQKSNTELALDVINNSKFTKRLAFHIGYQTFLYYNKGWFNIIDRHKFRSMMWHFFIGRYPKQKLTKNVIIDVIHQIEWGCLRQVYEEDKNIIAFKDTLYNLETGKKEALSRKKVVLHHFPFDFGATAASAPVFHRFLESSIVLESDFSTADKETIKVVQEMFGYFLLNNMKGAVAWFMLGEGSNGKSEMCHIIEEMVGDEFVSAMTIQALTTDKFKTHGLIGKRINISNEEESKYLKSDKFKALITGEAVDVERKYGDGFKMEPRTKFLFASNRLPNFEEINNALQRRVKIVPFHRIFKPSDKDYNLNLRKEMRKEIPGIVGWALKGAKRFIEQKYQFSDSRSMRKAMYEFEEEVSSSIRFARECYKVDKDYFINYADIYSHYKEWCLTNGKKPLSRFNFCKDMRRNFAPDATQKINGITQRGFNLIKQSEIDRQTQLKEEQKIADKFNDNTNDYNAITINGRDVSFGVSNE